MQNKIKIMSDLMDISFRSDGNLDKRLRRETMWMQVSAHRNMRIRCERQVACDWLKGERAVTSLWWKVTWERKCNGQNALMKFILNTFWLDVITIFLTQLHVDHFEFPLPKTKKEADTDYTIMLVSNKHGICESFTMSRWPFFFFYKQ